MPLVWKMRLLKFISYIINSFYVFYVFQALTLFYLRAYNGTVFSKKLGFSVIQKVTHSMDMTQFFLLNFTGYINPVPAFKKQKLFFFSQYISQSFNHFPVLTDCELSDHVVILWLYLCVTGTFWRPFHWWEKHRKERGSLHISLDVSATAIHRSPLLKVRDRGIGDCRVL